MIVVRMGEDGDIDPSDTMTPHPGKDARASRVEVRADGSRIDQYRSTPRAPDDAGVALSHVEDRDPGGRGSREPPARPEKRKSHRHGAENQHRGARNPERTPREDHAPAGVIPGDEPPGRRAEWKGGMG